MPTVEETVDFLLKNPARRLVEVKDIKMLVDLRRQTWWKNSGSITHKQQDLIQNLISKYLLVLKTHQWPVDCLNEPTWKTPIRESRSHSTWTVELVDGFFELVFPYNPDVITLLRDLQNYSSMIDRIQYQKETVIWQIENGVQGRKLLQYLLRFNSNWYIKPDVYQTIMKEQPQWPVVKYLNGEWHCDYESEVFQQQFQNIVQQQLSVPSTALRLCSLQPEFDHTVNNVLKTWFKPEQINWILDKQPIVNVNQIHSLLIGLIEQVDLWPVVVCDNKYHEHVLKNYFQAASAKFETVFAGQLKIDQWSNFKGFIFTDETFLSKNKFGTQRYPWMVYFPSYVDLYNTGDTQYESIPCIQQNFDKVLTLSR